jgi:opacity protein-like surface antigen
MKRVILLGSIVLVFALAVNAQDTPKYTFNIGGGPTFPVSDISNFANVGGSFVVGGGVNATHTIGFNAEFMWNDLPPKSEIIALTGAPDGSARMYSVTGNLLFHTPESRKLGAYGIGGIGWYHRSWDAFWGVVCTNGLVQSSVELAGGSSNAFGWNVGAGVTFRLGQSHAKFYTEVRYHHAYTSRVDTQVLPLTFGFRW